MKRAAQLFSGLALAGTLVPPILFFADKLTLSQTQLCMGLGALLWFASAPLWMEHKVGD